MDRAHMPAVEEPSYADLVQARMTAQAAFDQLWKVIPPKHITQSLAPAARKRNQYRIRRRAKVRAERWLAEQLGVQHWQIESMDPVTCAKVAELCGQMDAKKVRAWSKGPAL
jgi:hypothetical protein